MKKTRAHFVRALLFMAIFSLGVLTGGALMLTWSTQRLVEFFGQRNVTVHQKMFQRGVRRHVDLNAQEQKHMEAVFDANRPAHEALLRRHELEIAPFRRKLIKQLGQGFREAQRLELEKWFKAKEAKRWSQFDPPIDPASFKSSTK